MFYREEIARRRYNEYLKHYNEFMSNQADYCPYGFNGDVQRHEDYLAQLDREHKAAVRAERAEVEAQARAEERCRREERKLERELRREEAREREMERRFKAKLQEKQQQAENIDQLKAKIMQKQREVEQHQQACKNWTLSLSGKKNELETTKKQLGSKREALQQEFLACVKLNQEQEVIQYRIQQLSTSLATYEGLSFLHRGECIQENLNHRDSDFLESAGHVFEHAVEHIPAHFVGHAVQHGVTAAADAALGSTVASIAGPVVGGAAASLFLVGTLGENEPTPPNPEFEECLHRTAINSLQRERDQLLEQQRTKETELTNRQAKISTLKNQCDALESSTTLAEVDVTKMEQQRKAEQDKVRDLSNQKEQLQKKFKTEEAQLVSLEKQVRTFYL